jgi:esterase/lipase superfamily enzyme
MQETYFKWHSPNLGMEIEMLKFGHSGLPIIIFPTSLGRYYEAKDFKLIESARSFIDNGTVQILCPDGIDRYSWYNKQVHPAKRATNHALYDAMILEEIVEKIRFATPSQRVAVAGCSFGGYHAANFAFKHLDVVSHLFTMSGAFDIKNFMSGYYDDTVYYNNPMDYIGGLMDENLWKLKIVLGTSEWDICKDANFRLSDVLTQKNVHHWLDVRPQASHDWPVWREMFPQYLGLLNT